MTQEDYAVLNTFYRILIEESEAGYALFDQKPLCIQGFYKNESFSMDRQSVAIKEGARIWKKYKDYSDKKIYVHICNKEDPVIPGCRHVLVINIPLFHNVVNENLSLFQHVLGPSVTSSKLLDALIFEDQPFHSLLKNDSVLIGIILGYGTNNSLYVSRIEAIQEALEKITPPFLQDETLVKTHIQEYLPFKPSFGYGSGHEEITDLQQKITVSSKKLIDEKPSFIFGWVNESEKSADFITELEQTQIRIQKLLSSPDFLKQTIEKITEKKFIFPTNNKKFEFPFDSSEKEQVLANGLWESMQGYDASCFSYFLEGLNDSGNPTIKTDGKSWHPYYRQEMLNAKKNLVEAESIFHIMNTDNQFVFVFPHKLYYKINNKGDGETRLLKPFVNLSYSIFSPTGLCLTTQSNVLVNLNNTIPGFRRGVNGMQIGETRELWIHPSLAYGYDTPLEKCIYLRAVVTFKGQNEGDNQEIFPGIEPCDLSFLMDPKMENQITEKYASALLEKGKRAGCLLKRDKSINLVAIIETLKKLQGEENDSLIIESNQEIINRILWNIYFHN